VYFVGSNGTLQYYVPGSPGLVAYYRFTPDGSQAFRRVLTPDGTAVLRTEVVYLGKPRGARAESPITQHSQQASSRRSTNTGSAGSRLRLSGSWSESSARTLFWRPKTESTMAGSESGRTNTAIPPRVVWDEDASEGSLLDPRNDPHARFLAGLAAGMTDGPIDVLTPVVERVLFRTVTHPPRIAGGWEDLFQEGTVIAVRETAKLSPHPGEQLDDFAGRLDRRLATAVRHRLIDLIRRQDAAARNTPSGSLEAGEEAGMNVSAHDGDAFDLLFQPHERARRDARARAIALAVFRESRGLARRIIRRAYVPAFCGRCTAGTQAFRDHPDYPAAARTRATRPGRIAAGAA
jgi:hypothetical protein